MKLTDPAGQQVWPVKSYASQTCRGCQLYNPCKFAKTLYSTRHLRTLSALPQRMVYCRVNKRPFSQLRHPDAQNKVFFASRVGEMTPLTAQTGNHGGTMRLVGQHRSSQFTEQACATWRTLWLLDVPAPLLSVALRWPCCSPAVYHLHESSKPHEHQSLRAKQLATEFESPPWAGRRARVRLERV